MAGIDRFISDVLSKQIKKQLSNNQLRELEHSLFFDEGLSIKLSVEYFPILHNKIKKIQNIDPIVFEKNCLDKIIKIQNSKNFYIIKLVDNELIQKILTCYGDNELREILLLLMNEPKTIPKILDETQVSKTSAYRKIENLILDGIIVESGRIRSKSKMVTKYRCVFDQLIIQFKNNSSLIEAKLTKEQFEDSKVLKKLIKF